MYWCAVSTPSGQGAQIVAKWESVVSHVQNVHTGHGDLFPSCIHGRLEGRESHKKWLEPSSKAAVKLETLVILIAALHYNENANRVQDVTKTGEARFSINYPKGRKGAAVLRRVLESPTYEYAQELLEEIVKECTDKENKEASPLLFSSSSSFPSPSSPSSAGYHPPSSPNLSSSEDDYQKNSEPDMDEPSNECGGSYHMEKTGLERSLAHLERQGLAVGTMVTDRHRQIAKIFQKAACGVQ
ncbi:hypothetical protein F7725_000035 [Dissostichus mawsoni]|uniref:Uncharacterized protein n=1 Tax=Dissostichus mawsoni TaxID=36200 RepID=A0A7J5ZJY0_DISMA|nr:hypothetical protein F7725_000033 [Dissostichus mawsoni]KAF3861259.1 hypothetical protein F7725_000035 [Dissostichus mawsoni]